MPAIGADLWGGGGGYGDFSRERVCVERGRKIGSLQVDSEESNREKEREIGFEFFKKTLKSTFQI